MPLLEARGITKRFPGVVANDGVSVAVEPGEVLAIVGENGAGKSTLMNILYGLYQPDEGEILLRGRPVRFRTPQDAILAGVGMVHQHFMLIPPLTVAENVVLGYEGGGPLFDRTAAAREVARVAQEYGFALDPDARVERLTVGQQQKVEIVKALYRGAEVLILDEPTAVLTPQEAQDLFRVVRSLASAGRSVVFISHKLREVLEVADRVAVMRAGKLVSTLRAKETTEHDLAGLMVGREVGTLPPHEGSPREEVLLEVQGLSARNDKGLPALLDVSFTLRAGEILGIAGVDGNGQTELAEVLTGLRPRTSGVVRIGGREVPSPTPHGMRKLGVRHVPEDRQRRGLVLPFTVAENLALGRHRSRPFCVGPFLSRAGMRGHAREAVEAFDVRPRSIDLAAKDLSGGNQQKVILARELTSDPRLLVAVQPTRGLDVGAIEFVWKRLLEQRSQGKAVLLVSLDLDEVLALSDRVLVLYGGRVTGILPRAEATEDRLGRLMLGAGTEGV